MSSTLIEDPYLTAKQLAEETGNCIPAEFIRQAFYRGQAYHPLPHIKCGEKRPVRRTRLSTFEKWLEEEEKGTWSA